MNTEVKRSVRKKVPKPKPLTTYLSQELEQEFEFVNACDNEKLRISSQGDEFDPISAAEQMRILIIQAGEARRAEGWTREKVGLAPLDGNE